MKNQNHESVKSRFSINFWLSLTIITTVSTGLLAWNSINSTERLSEIQDKYNEIIRIQGQITHYDEVLTMSARMAAATGDIKWEKRYQSFVPNLDIYIKKLILLQSNEITSANETDAANIKLVEMETKALKLVQERRQAEASAILFSAEYEKQKGIYSNGTSELNKKMTQVVSKKIFLHKQRENLIKEMLLFFFTLSFIGWSFIFIKIRKWNKELKLINENLDSQVTVQSEKLLNSFKMSAVGEMAGGIAHEIRNPLTIISGTCSILKKQIENNKIEPVDMLKSLKKIDETIKRMTIIIQGLTTISRNTEGEEFAPVKLKELMEDVIGVCSERLKNNDVKFIINLEDPMFDQVIDCRRVQVSQVFVNLIGNSFDAIENQDDRWIKIECQSNNENIEFRLIDSGHGISKEIQEKIYQPFFTTKPVGKGTGLGLALSLSIVKEHAGTFSIDNENPNTCFVIKLPRIQNNQLAA